MHPGEEGDLPLEPPPVGPHPDLGAEHLEGDLAVVLAISREIDVATEPRPISRSMRYRSLSSTGRAVGPDRRSSLGLSPPARASTSGTGAPGSSSRIRSSYSRACRTAPAGPPLPPERAPAQRSHAPRGARPRRCGAEVELRGLSAEVARFDRQTPQGLGMLGRQPGPLPLGPVLNSGAPARKKPSRKGPRYRATARASLPASIARANSSTSASTTTGFSVRIHPTMSGSGICFRIE